MSYLQILNWVLFVGAACLALMFAVVSLVAGVYHEQIAAFSDSLPVLLLVTAAFIGFTLVAGLAVWALHTRHRLLWLGQGALLLALAGMVYLSHSVGQT